MGLFGGWARRVISRVTFGLVSPAPPRPPAPPPATPHVPGGGAPVAGAFAWGEPFGSDTEGVSQSNAGHDFTWYVAGYKSIGGARVDLEKDPSRVLTDSELHRADYLVIHFSGPIGYITVSGPWDDWDELWDDMAAQYDEGES